MSLTPAERSLHGKLAANTRWARERDRAAATSPARDARWNNYLTSVDPEGVLDPAERERRAHNAYKADMQRAALKASRARREKAETHDEGVVLLVEAFDAEVIDEEEEP